MAHSQNPVLRFRKKNSSTHKLAINKYFFLVFPFFRLLPAKADGVGGGFCLYACIQEKAYNHNTRDAVSLKNGVLKVFFLTQGITVSHFFYKYMCFGLFSLFRAFSE